MVDSNDSGGADPHATPEQFTESVIEEYRDFLEAKGGVVLLSELRDGPKRFVVLRDTLGVSPNTVQDRIEEAKRKELVSRKADYSGGDGYKRHPLTPKGKVLADELQVTDLARIRKEIWKLESEYDEKLDEFETMLTENADELNEELGRYIREKHSK